MLISSRSSIHYSNIIYSDQMNHSKAKMLYSFPKGLRFSQSPIDKRDYGNLPSSVSKRATSFGFGKKRIQNHST